LKSETVLFFSLSNSLEEKRQLPTTTPYKPWKDLLRSSEFEREG